jgi:hypothetical protein
MKRSLAAGAAFAALAIVLAASPAAAAAPQNPYDGDWHFTLSPYGWITGVTSTLAFSIPGQIGAEATVHSSAGDLLSNLKFAVMGTVSARKGEWIVFGDLIYADLGSTKAQVRTLTGPAGLVEFPVNVGTKVSLQQGIVTLGIGRSIYHDDNFSADGFAGVRWLGVKAALDFHFAGPLNLLPISGQLRNSGHSWDAIVGVKGRYAFERSRWFLFYYGDTGTGQSTLTGQVAAGPGYAFDWGDMFLLMRYLHYDNGGPGKRLQGIDLYGPAIGATFYL